MKSLILAFAISFAVGTAGAQQRNFGPQRAPTGDELYRRVAAACIEVLVDGRHTGSGWFADSSGLIVTAAHMVWEKHGRVEVMSSSLGRVEAKVVALDRGHDLALLEVARRDRSYAALSIAETIPEATAEIYLYGAPMFRHGVLLTGRVARPTASYEFRTEMKCYAAVYYVTGSSPAGTSGGCWVDEQGRVVGNQSGFISVDHNTVGISQVVPPGAIRRLVHSRHAPATADLGAVIEELWERPREFISKFPPGTDGVVVIRTFENGPAQLADVRPDSLIVAIDGRPIRYRDDLFDYVRSKKPGDDVRLQMLLPENSKPREVHVILSSLAN